MNSSQSALMSHVPAFPGDPILSLMEGFQADPRPNKVSLSIGLYFDENGQVPLLPSVRRAEAALMQHNGPRSYLPIDGLPTYRAAVQRLIFGASHEAVLSQRIATLQSPGGSGALKVGGDFLRRYFPDSGLWLSDPSWENHRTLFEGCGFAVNSYPYFDPLTGSVRIEDLLASLKALPERSIVLLHGSCHNPTGVDLSQSQWRAVIEVLQSRNLIPFIDLAYQGFGDGLDEDAFAPRAMADAGLTCLVANSFSNNFSLYGERCGALSVVCPDAATADRVLGQLKATVRANYSTPPMHGAQVIAQVLNEPELLALWTAETTAMRSRIRRMREHLHAALNQRFQGRRSFEYLLSQRGMFSYTGLSAEQVDRLRDEHAVYLVRSGRLCVSGLTDSNVAHVANAIAAVLETA